MIEVEKLNLVKGTNIFRISGEVEEIKNGFIFEYDGERYNVDSVGFISNGTILKRNVVEVIASKCIWKIKKELKIKIISNSTYDNK